MNALTKTLFRRLVRTGVRRGLIEGNRPWLVVGAFAWVARALLKPKRPVIRTERLEPGETIVISNVPAARRWRHRSKDHATE